MTYAAALSPDAAATRNAPQSPPVLLIEGLLRRHAQGGVAFELEVPSFTLERGSFVALVGDSGCGKSTLLDQLALVLRPTACQRFELTPADGRPPVDVNALWARDDEAGRARLRRENLGYVLQTGGLLPFLTVEQNLFVPPRIKGLHGYAEEVREMARRIGIDGVLAKKPQYLSGGQRQRAAIIRALAHKPDIILADEPTAAVDKKRAKKIVEEFRALATERNATIVMVTHDRDLVGPVADVTYGFTVTLSSETLTRSLCSVIAN